MVVRHPSFGYAIATLKPWAKFHRFQLSPDAGATISQLFNRTSSFEVVQNQKGMLLVRPIEAPKRVRREAPVLIIDPARFAEMAIEFEFPPPGSSELEKLALDFPDRAAERAYELSSIKNDATAWWILAFGHRSLVIRRIVEDCLRAVGIDRIARMVRQNHGTKEADWDPDFLDFVDDEVGRERRRRTVRGGKGPDLAGDLSGWDKPWWADD